ncbi:hypothetical protein [Paeniglutamicibacter terrestris]|uniref:Uncharacterized protein n=1 Tax=Paeniglutamicibacter terrestris TaxID=2723403 RepID=A0ABX1G843_9MICC|nr:hypothetical protein [Paeniglutamicibacter terrestris]NKG22194.1 hypothetical protein [Paeniglutamicibacter terrestris]
MNQSDSDAIDPAVEMMLSTLDSIFEEDPTPDPQRQRLTRRHSSLSIELEAFDNDPSNSLNRIRSEIVADLRRVIEEMQGGHD